MTGAAANAATRARRVHVPRAFRIHLGNRAVRIGEGADSSAGAVVGHAESLSAASGKSRSVSFWPAFFASTKSVGLRHSGMKFLSLQPMMVVSGMRLSRDSFAGPPKSWMMSDAVCMA